MDSKEQTEALALALKDFQIQAKDGSMVTLRPAALEVIDAKEIRTADGTVVGGVVDGVLYSQPKGENDD